MKIQEAAKTLLQIVANDRDKVLAMKERGEESHATVVTMQQGAEFMAAYNDVLAAARNDFCLQQRLEAVKRSRADFLTAVLRYIRLRPHESFEREQDCDAQTVALGIAMNDFETLAKIPTGWSFSPGQGEFKGKGFPITGTAWKTLKKLAEKPGEPVLKDDLWKLLDPESDAEETCVNDALSDARLILKKAFGIDKADPIPCVDRKRGAWKVDESVFP